MQTPLTQSPAQPHAAPWPHGKHVSPPQSTSVSVPDSRPSEQDGVAHVLFTQNPPRQSSGRLHAMPSPHGGQLPPQSRSVSVPLATPSLHPGGWHTSPMQTRLSQSEPSRHAAPGVHAAQIGPPQSVSVSAASFTPFVHVIVSHTPAGLQLPPRQSDAELHVLPSRQRGHAVPPQSTSDSSLFRTPSVHDAASQTLPRHTPEPQSRGRRQPSPGGQAKQSGPPQSVPVSWPLITPSLQCSPASDPASPAMPAVPAAVPAEPPMPPVPPAAPAPAEPAVPDAAPKPELPAAEPPAAAAPESAPESAPVELGTDSKSSSTAGQAVAEVANSVASVSLRSRGHAIIAPPCTERRSPSRSLSFYGRLDETFRPSRGNDPKRGTVGRRPRGVADRPVRKAAEPRPPATFPGEATASGRVMYPMVPSATC